MKIAIYVNYSSANFNNDFVMSNTLIANGHNVFLAVTEGQLNYFRENCDIVCRGVSAEGEAHFYDLPLIEDVLGELSSNN